MPQYYSDRAHSGNPIVPANTYAPALTPGEALVAIGVEVAKVVVPGVAGYQWGKSAGYHNGYRDGKAQGLQDGYAVGVDQGYRSRDAEVEALRKERDQARAEVERLQPQQELTAAVKDAMRQALPPEWTNLWNSNGHSTS